MEVTFFGESMLELSREPLHRNLGGHTINMATYMARFARSRSMNVTYATALGVDCVSDHLLERWQREEINTHLVMRIDNKLPGLYFVEDSPSASPIIHYWKDDSAARYYFSAERSPLAMAAARGEIEAFCISGISLAILKPESRGRLVMLVRQLKAQGSKIIFDNAFCSQRWNRSEAIEWYSQILPLADIAYLDESDEYAVWGKSQSIQSRCRLFGCPEVIVRGSGKPCLLLSSHKEVTKTEELASDLPEHWVNAKATRAAFFAAYLSERLAGRDMYSAAMFGDIVAGRVEKCHHGLIPVTSMDDLL
ncbi:2-dehydro-3-deoxygluconokinase [Veronia nyctiphanis]|uniref:2-dehydro-3-deoxygluconokinase n=1 Tax=Veronia nyctiphanis TaxID=1278244 RepID=A0A4Q0YP37_9GAMM|nr:PfkB family carbohydrate kinase [Veronia nyctiphanis]RXJ72770.1 2-dehydro-3-deoxygluconokinase [Veronia nyctiphanis]